MNTFFQLLEWDSNFFGFKVAKVNSEISSQTDYEFIKHLLKENQIQLAYLFVVPGSQMDVLLKENNVFLELQK